MRHFLAEDLGHETQAVGMISLQPVFLYFRHDLEVVYGKGIFFTGTIKTALGMIISYVSQNTGERKGDLSPHAWQYGLDESLFKAILRKWACYGISLPRI